MSRRRPPWSSLGIDPTNDERAIKRAYAAKLKAIDVETEPAKFIALRQRYEDALRESHWIGVDGDDDDGFGGAMFDDEDDDAAEAGVPTIAADEARAEPAPEDGWAIVGDDAVGDDAVGEGEPGDDPVGDGPPPARGTERANPWDAPKVDPVAAHFAAIEAALRAGGAACEAILDREMRALWAEPALETVDAAEDAERRLAHLALEHGVDAAFLLRLASWHYGWVRRSQRVGTEWPIREVGQRAAAENWFRKIENNESGYGRHVLSELGAPPTGNWLRDLMPKRRIREFLAAMRQHYPEGEYRFDPDIVDAWEEASTFKFPWQALTLGLVAAIAMAGRTRQSQLGDPMVWAWWIGVTGGLLLLTHLLARRDAGRRTPARLDRVEASAFAALLGVLAFAMLVPATPLVTGLLIGAAPILVYVSGAAPPTDARGGFWLRLAAGRYPLIAALIFLVHAMGEAPAGRMDWRQAVVPGMLALLTAHWLRPRLIASWEAAPRWLLLAVRYALLGSAAALLYWAATHLPGQQGGPVVLAGLVILLVQDAAADAYRRPLSTQFLIAYVLLVAGLVIMPLIVAMALVARRLADRLFIKA